MDFEHASRILRHITAAEREAAQLILEAHDMLAETKSSSRDVVTEYDRRVQRLLTERLREAVPEARFFCEESEAHDALDSEILFIIDPIDGTMNFVRRLHHSCISVALMSRGELWAGAVCNPYQDELFTAVKGGGAFCNGRPIRTDDAPLGETLVCVGTSPYRPDLCDKTFRLMRKVYDRSLDIRREGSAALDLCSVAAGRAGAYFELSLSLWDYAAGALLVWEAGGVCLAPDGSPLPFDASKPGVIAGGRQAAAELLRLAAEV